MLVLLFLAVLLISGTVLSRNKVITKTFEAKELVKINTISGDLEIFEGSSDEIIVEIVYNVRPRNAFEPRFKERKNSIRMSEEFHANTSTGSVIWTITVPKGTRIDFNTASGNLTAIDFSGEINSSTASGDYEIESFNGILELSTASGDYDIIDSEGGFELSSASGDINLENCHGEIEASTASGNVDARDIVLDEECDFSSASGDVYVELAESPKYDLSLSSASGNSVLNFNGNPIEGYFEFVSKERRGRIKSPFDFDDEDEFSHRGDRDIYLRKSFTKGGDNPRIYISTATGKAVLEES